MTRDERVAVRRLVADRFWDCSHDATAQCAKCAQPDEREEWDDGDDPLPPSHKLPSDFERLDEGGDGE